MFPPFIADTIQFGGETRHYAYYIPPGLTFPAPLCVVLHGGGQSIERICESLQMVNSADVPGNPGGVVDPPYIVLAPKGFRPAIPGGQGASTNPPHPHGGVWNSGHSTFGQLSGRDDVGFIMQLISEFSARLNSKGTSVDASRIYSIGFSNGGMMAYRLAAEKSETFAAICSIAGTIGGRPSPNAPPHVNNPLEMNTVDPVALFHIHGLRDGVVSPFGGPTPKPPPASRVDRNMMNSVNVWVRHNNCNRVPAVTALPFGTTMRFANGDNGTEVRVTMINGLRHRIPRPNAGFISSFLLAHSK